MNPVRTIVATMLLGAAVMATLAYLAYATGQYQPGGASKQAKVRILEIGRRTPPD